MALKRVIDADKICADQLFLRESAPAFRCYRCQPVMLPVLMAVRVSGYGRDLILAYLTAWPREQTRATDREAATGASFR